MEWQWPLWGRITQDHPGCLAACQVHIEAMTAQVVCSQDVRADVHYKNVKVKQRSLKYTFNLLFSLQEITLPFADHSLRTDSRKEYL